MEGTKACSKCGEVKPLSEFVRDSRNKSGRRAHCYACHRKANKAYIRSGKLATHVAKDLVQWKLRQLIQQSRFRAKQTGVNHNLDLNYLLEILPECCPYLGTQFHWEAIFNCGQRKSHPCSPSIDRIDSSKGYIKGNVAIVSHRANSIKNNASELELIAMGRRIAQLKMQLAIEEE